MSVYEAFIVVFTAMIFMASLITLVIYIADKFSKRK